MQDQRIPGCRSEVAYSEEHIDCEVLHLLLSEPSWPWHLDELSRELGSQHRAVDAVGRLVASGLLHRQGDFVFPTRSARRASALQLGTA
jgi:hypothetical protein